MKKTNPFEAIRSAVPETTAANRKIDLTPELVAISSERARQLMTGLGDNPELIELANKALETGDAAELISLIEAFHGLEKLEEDAQFLSAASEDVLSRLLESRRSDRSKAKKKNIQKDVAACHTWISAMYAELLVRAAWGKPYAAPSASVDYDDLAGDRAALTAKIKSLQSKLSRARRDNTKTPEDIQEIQNDIARLNTLRGTKISGTAAVEQLDTAVLRDILKDIPMDGLSEEQVVQLKKLLG